MKTSLTLKTSVCVVYFDQLLGACHILISYHNTLFLLGKVLLLPNPPNHRFLFWQCFLLGKVSVRDLDNLGESQPWLTKNCLVVSSDFFPHFQLSTSSQLSLSQLLDVSFQFSSSQLLDAFVKFLAVSMKVKSLILIQLLAVSILNQFKTRPAFN